MSSVVQRLGPFALPVSASLLLAAMAPIFRAVVKWLQDHLQEGFVPILGAVLAVAGLVTLVVAVVRIRERRPIRYGAVGLALMMVVVPILLSDRGTAREAAVERLHFVLYGLLAVLFYRAFERTGHLRWTPALALVAVALAGLLDEWVQWAVAVRTGEMFDVGLNIYSGLCGVILAFGLIPLREWVPRPAKRCRRLLVVLLLLLLVNAAVFVEYAHLGYAIDDPEIGRFHSRFTRDELLAIDSQRNEQWRSRPPNRPYRSYELQDHFEVEAGWRVKHRNDAFRAGDSRTAWKENQILERYYSAFLGLQEVNPRRFRFRLPSATVEQLRREQSQVEVERYASRADAGRIWVRPSRPQLWTAVAAIALALIALGIWPGLAKTSGEYHLLR